MGDRSAIEWTDATWTPLRARHRETGRVGTICVHKSAGCANCYSELFQRWTGIQEPFTPSGLKNVEPLLDAKILAAPLTWRKPRRIFVCSQPDLFGEWWPDEWIDKVFAVMALAPQHIFQVLTKRPERMRAYLSKATVRHHVCAGDGCPYCSDSGLTAWSLAPYPNVWLGVSVEDQPTADERIPLLLQTPAAVRFISYEPALGSISLLNADGDGPRSGIRGALHWGIYGGESGPGARPNDISWAREFIRQCRVCGIAPFVKQLGAVPVGSVLYEATWPAHVRVGWSGDGMGSYRVRLRDRKGGDWDEWPADLRVREFPA